MLASFFAALAAALVAITVAQTAAAYPVLPARVPMGFDYDGTVRFAPRPMIWFMIFVQAAVAAVIAYAGRAIAVNAPGTHGSLLGLSIVAACVMAMMWRLQSLMLCAAKSGEKRVSLRGFWLFSSACFAVVLFAVFAIG